MLEGESIVEDVDWRAELVWLSLTWGVESNIPSENDVNDCLLFSDCGRAQLEATRPRTEAYVATNMITRC